MMFIPFGEAGTARVGGAIGFSEPFIIRILPNTVIRDNNDGRKKGSWNLFPGSDPLTYPIGT